MDKLERLLKHLPRPVPAADLSARVRIAVHRRHIREVWLRRAASWIFGLSGLALASPAFSFFSVDLTSSGTPWLMQGLNLFQTESVTSVMSLWNGMFSLQISLGSSLIVSVWLGIGLMALGLFFGFDRRVFQTPMTPLKGDA
jgi:hypothetical protein